MMRHASTSAKPSMGDRNSKTFDLDDGNAEGLQSISKSCRVELDAPVDKITSNLLGRSQQVEESMLFPVMVNYVRRSILEMMLRSNTVSHRHTGAQEVADVERSGPEQMPHKRRIPSRRQLMPH
jgi:hypothetical protein